MKPETKLSIVVVAVIVVVLGALFYHRTEMDAVEKELYNTTNALSDAQSDAQAAISANKSVIDCSLFKDRTNFNRCKEHNDAVAASKD